jgi:REP element-mobilizing transposase RayT
MNRGVARRRVFEQPGEMRAFMALVALEVRAGRLEVHAYCLMPTHFHLLVRSPRGELSMAMCQLENRYVRWFNRRHRRDGPLFRGRFRSRASPDAGYRRILVRYIDQNPVAARIVTDPGQYPFGSAWVWQTGRSRPWLARGWILAQLEPWTGSGIPTLDAYRAAFGNPLASEQREWVERHQARSLDEKAFSAFGDDTPESVRAWMLRRARLGDGSPLSVPLISRETARRILAELAERPRPKISAARTDVAADHLIEVMLLRDLCGLRLEEVGSAMGISASTAHRRYRRHRVELLRNRAYADLAVNTARRAVAAFLNDGMQPPVRENA